MKGYWIIEWEEEDGTHYEKVVCSMEDGIWEMFTGDYPDNATYSYVNEPYDATH